MDARKGFMVEARKGSSCHKKEPQQAYYNDHNLKSMFLQGLSAKLDECLDTLARLLDTIHKLAQNRRKHFLDKIQASKNKLLGLKSNLREQNVL